MTSFRKILLIVIFASGFSAESAFAQESQCAGTVETADLAVQSFCLITKVDGTQTIQLQLPGGTYVYDISSEETLPADIYPSGIDLMIRAELQQVMPSSDTFAASATEYYTQGNLVEWDGSFVISDGNNIFPLKITATDFNTTTRSSEGTP